MNKMNLKRKGEKGITLIALIITIIVLLILAVVAIRAVQGDGIISKAKESQTKYQDAQKEEEESFLSQYEYELAYQSAKAAGSTTAKNVNEYVLKTVYGAEVGDYVNYNPQTGAVTTSYTSLTDKTGYDNAQVFNLSDYTGGWQILGVENGKLKLISSTIVQPSSGGVVASNNTRGTKYYSLKGETGYINGLEELNTISALYGQGNYAESARSVNIDDLMQASENFYLGSKGTTDFGKTEGPIGTYGIEVTYGIENGKLVLRGSNGTVLDKINDEDIDPKKFYYYDSETKSFLTYKDVEEGEKYTITNTLIGYGPKFAMEMDVAEINNAGLPWYDLLYKKAWYSGADNWDEIYWVASDRVYANPLKGYVNYGFFYIINQGMTATSLTKPKIENNEVQTTEDGSIVIDEKTASYGIRPVITLEAGIKLSPGSNNTHTTQGTAWTIVK